MSGCTSHARKENPHYTFSRSCPPSQDAVTAQLAGESPWKAPNTCQTVSVHALGFCDDRKCSRIKDRIRRKNFRCCSAQAHLSAYAFDVP